MSAPNHANHQEPDPLLAFFEEPQPSQPGESAEPAQAAEPVPNRLNPTPVPATDADPELRKRLECTERQLERVVIELSSVKGDLATLVNAVADIKKRMGRPPDRPATVVPIAPSRKLGWMRTVSAFLLR